MFAVITVITAITEEQERARESERDLDKNKRLPLISIMIWMKVALGVLAT